MGFQPEENDVEAEHGGGEEGEDSGADGGEGRAEKDGGEEEDEFNLEEVLRLGGTQVITGSKSAGYFVNVNARGLFVRFSSPPD